jgi:NDP-sugar pyrophosphorylase family protein
MPDGKLMLEFAISEMDLTKFSKVVVICLKEHVLKYLGENFMDFFNASIPHTNLEIICLDEATSSQSETVATALKLGNIDGPFLVKDCDNSFKFEWDGENQIATVDLNDLGKVEPSNKSYLEVNQLGIVTNIVEKRVVSNFFCCGAYGFSSPASYLRHYKSVSAEGEVYLSHIIYSMIISGEIFTTVKADRYIDLGTLEAYTDFKSQYATVFCDIDGVLFKNGSKFSPNGWKTEVIESNAALLRDLKLRGLLYLVVTTSRPESEKSYIETKLAEIGLSPDAWLMGLPHTKRVLVNDYSATNPYPSAVAVNLARDSDSLSSFMNGVM